MWFMLTSLFVTSTVTKSPELSSSSYTIDSRTSVAEILSHLEIFIQDDGLLTYERGAVDEGYLLEKDYASKLGSGPKALEPIFASIEDRKYIAETGDMDYMVQTADIDADMVPTRDTTNLPPLDDAIAITIM